MDEHNLKPRSARGFLYLSVIGGHRTRRPVRRLRMMGGCPPPSLARPSNLHRLDRKDSKIFVHPLGTRLDVCNGHTRSSAGELFKMMAKVDMVGVPYRGGGAALFTDL